MKLLLDADVLIGALDGDDSHHRQARELFTSWREQQATPLISVVNLTEVLVAELLAAHWWLTSAR